MRCSRDNELLSFHNTTQRKGPFTFSSPKRIGYIARPLFLATHDQACPGTHLKNNVPPEITNNCRLTVYSAIFAVYSMPGSNVKTFELYKLKPWRLFERVAKRTRLRKAKLAASGLQQPRCACPAHSQVTIKPPHIPLTSILLDLLPFDLTSPKHYLQTIFFYFIIGLALLVWKY
ncbi:hypothetical protein NEHOM01_0423 [Nematocida homosporus]|uniref:uncharacterized protein n=1 Tax=Nematocida homosporus TaxID=1912981 RepID=UPI002220A223|nr:uncharacterized protein NEHOM01_0423 [Nematocida homosporus]KAI5184821.1 hypothetical protein NEHOM01_0423 [Nematocida homosporus]